jgi:hypothetical protein
MEIYLQPQQLLKTCDFMEQLCSTSRLRDFENRVARLGADLQKGCDAAYAESDVLDTSSSTLLLRHMLAAFSHALLLMNQQCDAEGGPDMQLHTAGTIQTLSVALGRLLSLPALSDSKLRELVTHYALDTGDALQRMLWPVGTGPSSLHVWPLTYDRRLMRLL